MNGQAVLPWSLFARRIMLVLCGACLVGCSFYPLRYNAYTSRSLENWDDGEFLSTEEISSVVTRKTGRNEKPEYNCISTNTTCTSGTVRLSCDSSLLWANDISMVRAQLSKGRSYPLIIDTGAEIPLLLNDAHVRENHLPYWPVILPSGEWGKGGICRIDELSLGELKLKNIYTLYQERDIGFEVFGVPVSRVKCILLGLPVLIQFKYVLFDGPRNEVEISPLESFTVTHEGEWEVWPLRLDSAEKYPLYVKIPVQGQAMVFEFDTGSGGGINLRESEWSGLSHRLEPVHFRSSLACYPYCGGLLPIQKGYVESITIGERRLENFPIQVHAKDSKKKFDGQGLLGMETFKDTIMVLDFEHMQMWVKKTPEEGSVSKN